MRLDAARARELWPESAANIKLREGRRCSRLARGGGGGGGGGAAKCKRLNCHA